MGCTEPVLRQHLSTCWRLSMQEADIGLIGLAVMGRNLVLNMNDKGFTVAVYNRTVSAVDAFLADAAQGRDTIIGTRSVQDFVARLKRPRTIMLMVKAGAPVDQTIESVLPFLNKGDIVIDGGNSFFKDTDRRTGYLSSKGIFFIGTGVSGGEEGARRGPSIMPGGDKRAWPQVKKIFTAIAAKTPNGKSCCDWVGPGGAGHYVKMIHNGIEYGDMQLICEAYDFMRKVPGLSAQEMHQVVSQWKKGDLDSYLIDITSEILAYKDTDGCPLLDKILDSAGQKGTGKWTSVNSLDMGIPVTLIAEAVYARALSALKDERVHASTILSGGEEKIEGNAAPGISDIRNALLASKIVSYTQGFMLMREASSSYSWDLDFGAIALLWREGCIIRSVFLDKIKQAFDRNPTLPCLLLDDHFRKILDGCLKSWRRIVASAALAGIPMPAHATALSFYDGYRSANLPANLLQAQRDYFGAHTYERIDHPRGTFFHTNWTGTGGETAIVV